MKNYSFFYYSDVLMRLIRTPIAMTMSGHSSRGARWPAQIIWNPILQPPTRYKFYMSTRAAPKWSMRPPPTTVRCSASRWSHIWAMDTPVRALHALELFGNQILLFIAKIPDSRRSWWRPGRPGACSHWVRPPRARSACRYEYVPPLNERISSICIGLYACYDLVPGRDSRGGSRAEGDGLPAPVHSGPRIHPALFADHVPAKQ